MAGSEPFDGAELLVDFRQGGAVVVRPASAGRLVLRAPVFEMRRGRGAFPARRASALAGRSLPGLAGRAGSLGAQLRTQARIPALPAGPTILATSLATARQLTGDRSLTWPSARTATVDLGLRVDDGPGWFRVIDTDDRIYAARYSLADPTLAPPGHQLIQIAAACAPRERKADAERRVERLLDQSWPGWRAAVQWHRSAIRTQCTGAVDPPGTTWRDRPAVSRGRTLSVATDQSAAPGLLAEVGIAAAQLALQHLGETPGPTLARDHNETVPAR